MNNITNVMILKVFYILKIGGSIIDTLSKKLQSCINKYCYIVLCIYRFILLVIFYLEAQIALSLGAGIITRL